MISRSCLVAALLFAYGAAAEPRHDVTMALASTSFATAPARLAQELGLYAKHGLNAKFVVMDNASAATTALIAGSVNAALSGPGELVVAQARGQDVVLLANVYAGFSGTVVLAKTVADKLGVPPTARVEERLKALDGLVIASPSATGAYTVAPRGAAKAAGATIRFTYMSLAAMPAALESGAIQGFVAGAPFWALPLKKGVGTLWISGPNGEFPAEHIPASSADLQVMRDFATANPDWAKSLAAVFSDLTNAIHERPDDVKAALSKLYPDLDPGTIGVLFAAESTAWATQPPTPTDIARDIAFVKSIGTQIPRIETLDPAAMVYSGGR